MHKAFFERGEHLLLFTGVATEAGALRITKPIISMDTEFVADGVYPLDPPCDPDTSKRNTS